VQAKGLLHDRAKVNCTYILVLLIFTPSAWLAVRASWLTEWDVALKAVAELREMGVPLLVGLIGINAALGRVKRNGGGT